ncbi:DNA-protecting protein DprA [Patescibacteria group bacterium]|nr:DNA-protecting protein DprA [Patescibacteria group bacterium]
MTPDLPYWIALNEYYKFGPRAMGRLYDFFDSMESAFNAGLSDLLKAGIPQNIAEGFVHLRSEIDPDALMSALERQNVDVWTINDETFPPLLKTIYDPPPVLFVRGKLPSAEYAHLAVVGSRAATDYGLQMTRSLISDIAEAGVVIVSGLAFGIDEAAHMATVKAGGVTVAVIASGIFKLTSRQHYLADRIIATGGAMVSEFPLKMQSLRHNFPFRNRVISGMSHGTLVMEATVKSGSLITARAALEQGRDVFALPGPIHYPTSAGTNNLLKMGAHVATCAADILDILKVEHVRKKALPPPKPDSKEEALILDYLSKTPIHIDELTRATQLEPTKVASTLSLMEMKGRARQIGGMYYILV